MFEGILSKGVLPFPEPCRTSFNIVANHSWAKNTLYTSGSICRPFPPSAAKSAHVFALDPEGTAGRAAL